MVYCDYSFYETRKVYVNIKKAFMFIIVKSCPNIQTLASMSICSIKYVRHARYTRLCFLRS